MGSTIRSAGGQPLAGLSAARSLAARRALWFFFSYYQSSSFGALCSPGEWRGGGRGRRGRRRGGRLRRRLEGSQLGKESKEEIRK
jgi:hypothetical protein